MNTYTGGRTGTTGKGGGTSSGTLGMNLLFSTFLLRRRTITVLPLRL
ncbi:hypothetical protein A2U01_0115829, partial [Trifolium medium]|nr:hypothetical protein [Trifolium medium]